MKFHYYPETDSLYIDLSERKSVDSREVAPGVVLDFDESGNLVGIDIDQGCIESDSTFKQGDQDTDMKGGDGVQSQGDGGPLAFIEGLSCSLEKSEEIISGGDGVSYGHWNVFVDIL